MIHKYKVVHMNALTVFKGLRTKENISENKMSQVLRIQSMLSGNVEV